MDLLEWFNKAIRTTDSLNNGFVFCVKDLFEGVEWTSLAKGDRLKFGKYFKNEVIEGHVPNVVFMGKSDNNSAKYRKEIENV